MYYRLEKGSMGLKTFHFCKVFYKTGFRPKRLGERKGGLCKGRLQGQRIIESPKIRWKEKSKQDALQTWPHFGGLVEAIFKNGGKSRKIGESGCVQIGAQPGKGGTSGTCLNEKWSSEGKT